MEKYNVLEMSLEVKLFEEFYREEFKKDNMTWDEFVDKILSDHEFMKNTFASYVLDNAHDIAEEIADRVLNNQYVIIIHLREHGGSTPKTVR